MTQDDLNDLDDLGDLSDLDDRDGLDDLDDLGDLDDLDDMDDLDDLDDLDDMGDPDDLDDLGDLNDLDGSNDLDDLDDNNLWQEGLCNKESAPSVSSISRVLRGGGQRDDLDQDPGRPSHSINEILGMISSRQWSVYKTTVIFQ